LEAVALTLEPPPQEHLRSHTQDALECLHC